MKLLLIVGSLTLAVAVAHNINKSRLEAVQKQHQDMQRRQQEKVAAEAQAEVAPEEKRRKDLEAQQKLAEQRRAPSAAEVLDWLV